MSSRRPNSVLSMVSLTLLALVAAGLSVAALLQNQTTTAVEVSPSTAASATPTSSPTMQETVTQSAPSETVESTLVDSQPPPSGSIAVILGDRHSTTDIPNLWTQSVSEELGWSSVINLSSLGRGYIQEPLFCNTSQCSNFEGTIPAVVEQDPDVVVTFGGMADGDQDLSDAAAEYFTALREALPEAELIAISPVTSEDEAPYFLRLHDKTIRAGVEAVGGRFIDVGRPGVGDGDQLSPAAQDEVAQAIIAELP